MSLAMDLKRALHKSKHGKTMEDQRSYNHTEPNDSKARHILGLDMTHTRPTRNNSTNTTPTTKLRSVTFSDATTAAASSTETAMSEKEALQGLSHKSSSSFLRRGRQPELQINTVKPRGSSSSLRSFYDKSRTPLSVSQQTSDSSSRDFALRKGAPSVVSLSTQDSAHSRQLRVLTKPRRNASQGKSRFTPSVTKLSNSSSRSPASSLHETNSDTADSLLSQPSTSRISILRSVAQDEASSPASTKYVPEAGQPFSPEKPTLDPARAKINVRRPKAGTKNWFDSLESDSSDDEHVAHEPQLAADFALEVTDTCAPGSDQMKATKSAKAAQTGSRLVADPVPGISTTTRCCSPTRKRKLKMFEEIDLMNQSVLYVGSSDDDDDDWSLASSQQLDDSHSRLSVMSGPWDNAQIEIKQPLAVSTKDSERILQQLQNGSLERPPIPPKSRNRMITYLEDCSTETVTQQNDLLTSFPPTPTDDHSRNASLRGSVLSEDESISSTKLMPVTRQEESLIAAMRLKKTAMKRAQMTAHRQSALKDLERANHPLCLPVRPEHAPTDANGGMARTETPSIRPHIAQFTRTPQHSQRTDSVTTFQTDSVRQQSVRSSIATYLSEGSEDLQLPYSSIYGLPMGSSQAPRAMSQQSDRPRRSRDTYLSERSTTSTYPASPSEWSSNARDSHIVELDPLNRQMLREEIPSQLFMESPFLGWEARANMQTAH